MLTSSARPQPVRWGLHRPIVLTLAILAVVLATVIPLAFGAEVDPVYAIASKLVLCAFAVALLTSFGWWAHTGFLALPARRDLGLARPAGPPRQRDGRGHRRRWSGADRPWSHGRVGLVALGTGFSEEALFRGVLLEDMRPWGTRWALIGSAVAFSLIHFAGSPAGRRSRRRSLRCS